MIHALAQEQERQLQRAQLGAILAVAAGLVNPPVVPAANDMANLAPAAPLGVRAGLATHKSWPPHGELPSTARVLGSGGVQDLHRPLTPSSVIGTMLRTGVASPPWSVQSLLEHPRTPTSPSISDAELEADAERVEAAAVALLEAMEQQLDGGAEVEEDQEEEEEARAKGSESGSKEHSLLRLHHRPGRWDAVMRDVVATSAVGSKAHEHREERPQGRPVPGGDLVRTARQAALQALESRVAEVQVSLMHAERGPGDGVRK